MVTYIRAAPNPGTCQQPGSLAISHVHSSQHSNWLSLSPTPIPTPDAEARGLFESSTLALQATKQLLATNVAHIYRILLGAMMAERVRLDRLRGQGSLAAKWRLI
jgi:hypothetical protein